ncbi:MAG: hypothetical protein ACYTFG_00735 [Planctomycetota bacterium]|jgi:hypothetical protein
MDESKDKTWKPPEGKIMNDQMGLVSRAEKIEKLSRYVTRFYWIPLGIPMLLYFVYMIVGMFLFEGDRAKGGMLDSASFMFVLLMVIFTHSRIDAIVSLLREQGLLEAKGPEGEAGEAGGEASGERGE